MKTGLSAWQRFFWIKPGITKDLSPVLKQLLPYTVARVVPALLHLIIIFIATRFYPPEVYGVYVLVMVTISLLERLITNWLSSSIIRFFPQMLVANQTDQFFATLRPFVICVPLGAGLILALWIAIGVTPLWSNEWRQLFQLGVWLFVFSSYYQALLNMLRAARQAVWYMVFEVGQGLVGAIISLFLIVAVRYDISALLWGPMLSNFVAAGLLLAFLSYHYPLWKGKFSLALSKKIVAYSSPMVFVNLALWVLTSLDRYLLQLLRGAGEVGFYHLGCLIPESVFFFIGNIFMLGAQPAFIDLYERKGIEAVSKLQHEITRLFLTLALPLFVLFSFIGKSLVGLFAGAAYHASYQVIPWVSLGAIALLLYHLVFTGLYLKFKMARLTSSVLAMGLFNILLNLIFIPRFGFLGAGIATAISHSGLLLTGIWGTRSIIRFRIEWQDLVRLGGGAITMGGVIGFVQFLALPHLVNLIVSACVGLAVYVVVVNTLRGQYGFHE